MLTDDDLNTAMARCDQLGAAVARVIHGKDDVIRLLLVALLAEGHVLLEDRPGVGKTTLARSMGQALQVRVGRIQFTPDLLPSDITGTPIYNQATGEFRFRQGPVFNNIVVGDEINRASPKTQSALLEVMEERTVTADGVVHPVPRPFIVLATQNPIDMEGTYSLPEAQLDRFVMRLPIGYPDQQAEAEMLRTHLSGSAVDTVRPVLTHREVDDLIAQTKRVEVSPAIESYLVSLADFTRNLAELRLGVSPRGTLALGRAARAFALSLGQGYVTPDHVKVMAPWVLAHRILLSSEAELSGQTDIDIIRRALSAVPVPRTA
ncbi:MAG: MoxR family ATPase [Nitriliruptoraceae bacterium]